MEREDSAFSGAFGFLGLIFQSLAAISMARRNLNPIAWYTEVRNLESISTCWLKISEYGYEPENKWDRKWHEKFKRYHKDVKDSMKDYNELTSDNIDDSQQVTDISESKQKTFEPLHILTTHFLVLLIKKGWLMPESRDIGL